MKMHEINQLSREEIAQRLTEAREELQNLKFQLATHQLDNQVKVRVARRSVARLVTILHEFELNKRQEPEKTNR
jgi:large subunit ribosomal protein L29